MKIKTQKGSVLLEAVIALAAIVLTVAGISTVVTLSVSNSTFVRSQNNANKFAQDGMEYLRSLKDTDYTTFSTLLPAAGAAPNKICFPENFNPNSFDMEPACPPAPTPIEASLGQFKREVWIYSDGTSTTCFSSTPDPTNPQSDTTTNEVVVIVSWSSGKCTASNRYCHKSELRSCFSKPSYLDSP